LMSEDAALEAGISADRMVYLAGGAAAAEADDYLQRDAFTHSAAQEAVLKTVAATHAADHGFEGLEVYSCFPCVPKMARRTLRLAEDVELTVTGGLSFFGGPMSNYMTHAICAMVRRLRERRGTGLLYGQGDFVTKHHALVLSTQPPQQGLDPDYRVETMAAQLRGPVPSTRVDAAGNASIETFTVIFDRSGKPERGVVVARTADGCRTLARVPPADGAAIARLMDQERSPVAAAGWLASAADGLLEWRFL
jgi:acetyl-CoA C-acetyltransferase